MVYFYSGTFIFISALMVVSFGFAAQALGLRTSIGRTFLLFILSTFLWNLSYGLYLIVPDKDLALWIYRFGSLGWGINPSLTFYYAYLIKKEYGRTPTTSRTWALVLATLPVPPVLFQVFSGKMMSVDLIPGPYGWAEVIEPGNPWNIFYLAITGLSVVMLVRTGFLLLSQGKNNRARLHGRLFVVPGIIITAVSVTTNLVFPMVGILGVPPFSQVLVGLWGFATSLVLLRFPIFTLSPKIAAETIVNVMSDLCFLVDLKGSILSANPAVQNLLGYNPLDLTGKPMKSILPESLVHMLDPDTAGEEKTHELYIPTADGSALPCWVLVRPMVDTMKDPVGFVVIANEVRELKRLQHLASTDKLTGAYNRRPLEQALAAQFASLYEEAARGPVKGFNLIMADLDHFKAVNDTLGHETGDRVLQEFAAIVTSSIRTDDMFVRWGGEEFVILTPGGSIDTAGALAERIRSRLHHHIFPGGHRVTCSFGVVRARADQALYAAKSRGRNKVVQEDELRA